MLERLARHTSFSVGREQALALRPVTDRDEVVRRQRQTAEAVRLAELRVDVPLGGASDIRPLAESAARGRVLTASELLQVADTARAADRTRNALARVAIDAPLLSTVARGAADLGPLRGLIRQTIDDRGEILDDATPELAEIRHELSAAHDRLQQRMEALLRSADLRGALQDPIVTLREGRYVFPVRSEARASIPGVVHDSSASGATVYVEPLAVVELGNRWRELQAQERHEVERILRDLSDAVGAAAEELRDAVERLALLDVAVAKARLAEALDATALAAVGTSVPWIAAEGETLHLAEARHPLLTGKVVPVTITVGGDVQALLITGPNTGGKTVALKTAGLLTLMALAGLPVPAEASSRVPVYDAVFADIGDEQSIEQSLSTFSGHMTAIIDILERAGPRSLVLLDELGAGTDPTEGAALATAIVERLVEAGVSLIATTHHSELKLYAHRTEHVANASVEFDLQTLTPTYRLRIGLPGQSNALAIAARLGMPADIVEAARSSLGSEQHDLESVLGELREQLSDAEQRAAEAAVARDEAEAYRADLERRLADLVEGSDRLRDEARGRVQAEVRDVERLVQRARRRVESARLEQATADLERAQQAARELAPRAPEPLLEPPVAPATPPEPSEVRVAPGAAVWVRGIDTAGEALEDPDERGEFSVLFGSLRTRVRLQQVERTEPPGSQPPQGRRISMPPTPRAVPEQVEVRGQTLDEAIPAVEAFLDSASRAGRNRVLVIHGKGTGRLRGAIRELLSEHPLVSSYETAGPHEGGEGVTVAYLSEAG